MMRILVTSSTSTTSSLLNGFLTALFMLLLIVTVVEIGGMMIPLMTNNEDDATKILIWHFHLIIDFPFLWVGQYLVCLEENVEPSWNLLAALTCEISLNLSPAFGFLSGWNLVGKKISFLLFCLETFYGKWVLFFHFIASFLFAIFKRWK